jgi:hypothetical protein
VGSNAFDLNLGPIKSNRTGIALEDSGLQSLTGTLISMHAPLQYAIAENDHPDGNKGPLHRKRRTPSLVHSGVGPKAWQREVHDVTMSMSTLLHCSGQDTAPGSSENPISVDDGDTDVAMAG